ncbi:MAG: hypothetical protein KAG84_08520, partial [Bacteroidales bacterium]|nr:hypothetical protein [Bacteroidales bacterium]
MKRVLLIFIIGILSLNAKTQDLTRNNVFVELGGLSYYYSLNYERLLTENVKTNFTYRIGLSSSFPFEQITDASYIIPMSFSLIRQISDRNFYFEAKAILAFSIYKEHIRIDNSRAYTYEYTKEMYPDLGVGVRWQPTKGGFFWNITLQLRSCLNTFEENSDNELGFPL